MIIIKKILLVSAVVATVVTGYIVSANGVLAQNTTNPMDTLVAKIADKFGLNKNDVQSVFSEHRSQMQEKMQAQFEARLSQLVKDGKITETQKALILKKHEELKNNKESLFSTMKDKTPEERKTLMEQHRKEMEDWAKQNGIDPQYLFWGGMGFRHGFKMMWK